MVNKFVSQIINDKVSSILNCLFATTNFEYVFSQHLLHVRRLKRPDRRSKKNLKQFEK